ncbi:AzlD domain-containing protein [Brevibacillus ruminantium]|uniref:AzlD domain-containing protein n=1 Tax=Brevibacillus ruminantium TaxID=2950604 RepID=A0ABY4W939_9BACL|nr:AzlD domain-containing protein [Brevibacillus ruminantium]USG63573.1 AzlD domain-containing protein [Brevibacillus ruminantium]
MKSELYLIFLIVAMGGVTYISRRAFLRVPDSFFNSRLKNGLEMIPIGIFAGLIFPSLFVKEGAFSADPLFVGASLLCVLIMLLWKNVFLGFGLSLLAVILAKILGSD